ncbi:uncharacterized protein C8Q71DRAFT_775712 [Rhodofomes roseus]|uniref:NADP-dependent oxidoreductase domain-containing protein n=1 Tax=Rhodofomes roseus TaxID=34475 RepID=A0ABQ8K6R9_9APHY|nr:uncharacterized protein C8Q71DRAFT_775712 [Rhodofomes roseus]KAH9832945.1 hypothetical protein C8Q71DRAFT_775712 [Rhodofomes roseus]
MGIGAFYGKTTDKEQAFELLTCAVDHGITSWDTAAMYGSSSTYRDHRAHPKTSTGHRRFTALAAALVVLLFYR